MACIDIFQPGRLLTVAFLGEQIWLRSKGRRILATEVYDVLLRVDDDQELTDFLVASPHFCRRRIRRGRWKDNIHLVSPGDHTTKWGWFYYGDGQTSKHQRTGKSMLTLRVPESILTVTSEEETRPYTGEWPSVKGIEWCPDFESDSEIGLMQEMKKSVYKVSLDSPLQPGDDNAMWFRLLVEPVLLDVPSAERKRAQSVLDYLTPEVTLTGTITCPLHVRSVIVSRLQDLEKKHKERADEIVRLQSKLIDKGVHAKGTSTRIEDHRVMLAGHGVSIDIQGGTPPSLAYFGAQSTTVELPRFGNDYTKKREPRRRKVRATIHHWSGGSVRNGMKDLIAVASIFRQQAEVRTKTIDDLVQAVTPAAFREGCELVRKMAGKELGLLKLVEGNDAERCEYTQMAPDRLDQALANLRRMYLDPGQFSTFPQARSMFTDLHDFRIVYTASWGWWPRVRFMLINALFLMTVIAFGLSVRNFLRNSPQAPSAAAVNDGGEKAAPVPIPQQVLKEKNAGAAP